MESQVWTLLISNENYIKPSYPFFESLIIDASVLNRVFFTVCVVLLKIVSVKFKTFSSLVIDSFNLSIVMIY